MLKNKKLIENYINTFENLNIKNLNKLSEIFNDDIIFKDPFNAIKGKQYVIKIFEKMFPKTHFPDP